MQSHYSEHGPLRRFIVGVSRSTAADPSVGLSYSRANWFCTSAECVCRISITAGKVVISKMRFGRCKLSSSCLFFLLALRTLASVFSPFVVCGLCHCLQLCFFCHCGCCWLLPTCLLTSFSTWCCQFAVDMASLRLYSCVSHPVDVSLLLWLLMPVSISLLMMVGDDQIQGCERVWAEQIQTTMITITSWRRRRR